jgi:hypothetical protein
MFVRIIIGAIVGGLLVFFGGFVTHMFFDWGGRSFSRLADERQLVDFFSQQQLPPGIYGFPEMPADFNQLPAEQQNAAWTAVNDRYKAGPNGTLILGPTGEDMMGSRQLVGECLSNIAASLLLCLVLARIGPENGYGHRFLACVIFGLFAWCSLDASYAIWYRFPWAFVRDELLCSLFEWTLAGFALAAIVRPKKAPAPAAGSAA